MNNPLRSPSGLELLKTITPDLHNALEQFDLLNFTVGHLHTNRASNAIESNINNHNKDDNDFLNDIWVLHQLVDLVVSYGETWSSILNREFKESWNHLQNCLDHIRNLKRHSSLNLEYFEKQLTDLEKLYPYKIFFSIGAVVESFECSICGADIDSLDCPHIMGDLYYGKMACAMATKLTKLDHVSMVKTPKDKRCTVDIPNNAHSFNAVKTLSDALTLRHFTVLAFGNLTQELRTAPNPEYIQLRRNDKCFCGSNKKFKKCCIDKHIVEFEHYCIHPSPILPSSILA